MKKRTGPPGYFSLLPDGTLPRPVVTEFVAIRERIREDEGCGGQCAQVAEVVHSATGWWMKSGVYLGPDGEPIGDHVWNVMDDGTVIDATADQFCEGHDGVRVVRPTDPEFGRYRWEWTADYNPGLADLYPELAGIEWTGEYDFERSRRVSADRGRGWWLTDPSTWKEWTSPRDPSGTMSMP